VRRIEQELASYKDTINGVRFLMSWSEQILRFAGRELTARFEQEVASWEDTVSRVRFWMPQILHVVRRELTSRLELELANWKNTFARIRYLTNWSEQVLRFAGRELSDAFMKELANWKVPLEGVSSWAKQLWYFMRNGRFARFPISFEDLPAHRPFD
jgi:hypothetical protein